MTGRPLSLQERAERVRLGATIRELREARGIRPDQFANMVGISRAYLANIEAGRKPLTERLAPLFAEALGVGLIPTR